MWKKDCQEIVNLEELENFFTSFYGETHRQEIHDKFARTSFIFIATDEYLVYKKIQELFPNAHDYVDLGQVTEMIRNLEQDPKSILKYINLIQELGYDKSEILHKDALHRKYTLGPKYEEFISKITEAKSILPIELTLEEKVLKEFQEKYPELNIESIPSLQNILESYHDLDLWKQDFYQEIYLRNFNTAFGTGFESIEEIENHFDFSKIISDIENLRKNYWEKKPQEATHASDNNSYIISENEYAATNRMIYGDYSIKSNLLGYALPAFTHNDTKDIYCDVVIKVNENTAYSTLAHELTHVLHRHENGFAFDVNKQTQWFNEIVTDYLTTEMIKQIPDKDYHYHFKKEIPSDYVRGFSIMGNFLEVYKDVLKKCQFSLVPLSDITEAIGVSEFFELLDLTNRYMDINEFTYISKINEGLKTNYTSFIDIIENSNLIRNKFADNEGINTYIDTVESLYSLNIELAQRQQVKHERDNPISL